MRSWLGRAESRGSAVLDCRGAPSSGPGGALPVCGAFRGVGSTRGHSEVNEHCGKNQRAPKQYNKWHAESAISASTVYRNNSIRICCACYDRRWAQIVRAVNRIKAHSKRSEVFFFLLHTFLSLYNHKTSGGALMWLKDWRINVLEIKIKHQTQHLSNNMTQSDIQGPLCNIENE